MAEKDVRTLRDMVKLVETFAQLFDQAERLARALFCGQGCVPLPYFTPHDATHCEAVEKYLNWIIWGTEEKPLVLGLNDFRPTPEEAMYLLSSAWLHDIGMMYGIFQGEKPGDLTGNTQKVMILRNEHEFRASRYIHDVWKLFCEWEQNPKIWLSSLCVYHRRHHPISSFEPGSIISMHDGRPIRFVTLAALLRLADACHEDQSRAPGRLMELYKSLGMPQEAANYWERAKLITGVSLDHTNRIITVTGCCPSESLFNDLGKFDLGEIIEIIRQDIEEEIRGVQPVLLPYPNIYFGEVKQDIRHPPDRETNKEEQYLALWPYLLDKPCGSIEAVAALAQILLFAVKDGQKNGNLGTAWQDTTLFPIMNKTQQSRPFDFMIRNLCYEVKDILLKSLPDVKCPEALTKYLRDFLDGISQSCCQIAKFAPGLVGPNDAVMVYGYCMDIAKFLESLKAKYSNTLYIVDYQEPIGKERLGPSENARMLTFAKNVGFDQVRFLSLASFTQALDELKRKKIICKVLLGTHGVLKSKDFLCKVGSYVLASTAKNFAAQVIVFAEEAKFLINGESEEDVASREKVFSSERMCKRHPTMIDAICLTPEIDLVPKELVDLVLTEKGAFKPEAVPIPAEQPTNGLASERKESNPA